MTLQGQQIGVSCHCAATFQHDHQETRAICSSVVTIQSKPGYRKLCPIIVAPLRMQQQMSSQLPDGTQECWGVAAALLQAYMAESQVLRSRPALAVLALAVMLPLQLHL